MVLKYDWKYVIVARDPWTYLLTERSCSLTHRLQYSPICQNNYVRHIWDPLLSPYAPWEVKFYLIPSLDGAYWLDHSQPNFLSLVPSISLRLKASHGHFSDKFIVWLDYITQYLKTMLNSYNLTNIFRADSLWVVELSSGLWVNFKKRYNEQNMMWIFNVTISSIVPFNEYSWLSSVFCYI